MKSQNSRSFKVYDNIGRPKDAHLEPHYKVDTPFFALISHLINMSYNGIGLQTPRGTGTSGYVQKNLADKKVQGYRKKREREAEEAERKAAKERQVKSRRSVGEDIREHERKREIELKCAELRDKLEDEDEKEAVIEKKVAELRLKLTKREEQPKKAKDSDDKNEIKGEDNIVNEVNDLHEQDAEDTKGTNTSTKKPAVPKQPEQQVTSSYNYKPRYGDR
ncbi:Serine/arginine repetitive matrix protein 2 [Candidozyma auris]